MRNLSGLLGKVHRHRLLRLHWLLDREVEGQGRQEAGHLRWQVQGRCLGNRLERTRLDQRQSLGNMLDWKQGIRQGTKVQRRQLQVTKHMGHRGTGPRIAQEVSSRPQGTSQMVNCPLLVLSGGLSHRHLGDRVWMVIPYLKGLGIVDMAEPLLPSLPAIDLECLTAGEQVLDDKGASIQSSELEHAMAGVGRLEDHDGTARLEGGRCTGMGLLAAVGVVRGGLGEVSSHLPSLIHLSSYCIPLPLC